MTEEIKASQRMIACPRCKKQIVYSPENQWRPFCSERCKIIDVAAWANEEYRLDAGPAGDHDLVQQAGDEEDEY